MEPPDSHIVPFFCRIRADHYNPAVLVYVQERNGNVPRSETTEISGQPCGVTALPGFEGFIFRANKHHAPNEHCTDRGQGSSGFLEGVSICQRDVRAPDRALHEIRAALYSPSGG